jgi:hypothetical protein
VAICRLIASLTKFGEESRSREIARSPMRRFDIVSPSIVSNWRNVRNCRQIRVAPNGARRYLSNSA